MDSVDIEATATFIANRLIQGAGRDGVALFRQLILLLARGEPVPPDALAHRLGLPLETVMARLRRNRSLEWDEAGRIVGAGLTLRPTPHRFQVDGRRLYTWCALDALMYPGLIGRRVEVESPCLGTGTPVRVTVTPEAIEHVAPPEAVVSFVAPRASPDVRRVFCDFVHFFRSPQAAADWLKDRPGIAVLPVAAAFQLGRRLNELRAAAERDLDAGKAGPG